MEGCRGPVVRSDFKSDRGCQQSLVGSTPIPFRQHHRERLMELAQILAELPEDCLYAAEQDLWLRPEADEVVVGAVRFVVAHGDFMLFYPRPCEIPVMRERSLGVMETAKTAVAITCPISCTIIETNQAAQQNIDVVIQDPYGAGWLYRLKPMAWQDESMFLMGVKEYRDWLSAHHHERLRPVEQRHEELPPIDPQNVSY
jgi:glycine cleavage system H protein